MRYVTFRRGSTTQAGRVERDRVIALDAPDAGALIARGYDAAETGDVHDLDALDLAPVVTRPGKVYCVGHNYRAHIAEMGAKVPDYPTLFSKTWRALTGPNDDIAIPSEIEFMDWEAELVTVIGREVRRASARDAAAAIAGFTVGNDVSCRDWQYRTPQWLAGKGWEACSPIGPALVTTDEVGVLPDCELSCRVDGVEMQSARTSDLLFTPVELVRYISTFVTLDPGDVIFTGTPGGVGWARDPKISLQPGNVVESEISGLGRLRNRFV